VTGPLLIDGFGSSVRLRGARLFEAGPTAALWVPAGRPRLSLYAIGHYYDRWLSDRGAVYLWPEERGKPVSGWLSMRLVAPRQTGPVKLTFRLPGGTATSVRVRPGRPERLNIQVCGSGRWTATFRSDVHGLVGLRAVSVKATAPVFRASASACPEPEPVA
jgi:hypothetical protein